MVGRSVAFGNSAAYGMKSLGDANQKLSKLHSASGKTTKSSGSIVEDAILMVEVKPSLEVAATMPNPVIGQVVLKRLITADQAIEIICNSRGFDSA